METTLSGIVLIFLTLSVVGSSSWYLGNLEGGIGISIVFISVVAGILIPSVEHTYAVMLHSTFRQPGGEVIWHAFWVVLASAGAILAAGSAGYHPWLQIQCSLEGDASDMCLNGKRIESIRQIRTAMVGDTSFYLLRSVGGKNGEVQKRYVKRNSGESYCRPSSFERMACDSH